MSFQSKIIPFIPNFKSFQKSDQNYLHVVREKGLKDEINNQEEQFKLVGCGFII